jgi:steroid delta-isomerase
MSRDGVANLVKSYFASIRAMDVEAWLAHFAADAVSHDPVGGTPLRGHAAMRQFFDHVMSRFETVGLHEDSVFLTEDRAAVKWTGRDVGKNGRPVTFHGIDIFELDAAGKIRTLWAYWDPAATLAEVTR